MGWRAFCFTCSLLSRQICTNEFWASFREWQIFSVKISPPDLPSPLYRCPPICPFAQINCETFTFFPSCLPGTNTLYRQEKKGKQCSHCTRFGRNPQKCPLDQKLNKRRLEIAVVLFCRKIAPELGLFPSACLLFGGCIAAFSFLWVPGHAGKMIFDSQVNETTQGRLEPIKRVSSLSIRTFSMRIKSVYLEKRHVNHHAGKINLCLDFMMKSI